MRWVWTEREEQPGVHYRNAELVLLLSAERGGTSVRRISISLAERLRPVRCHRKRRFPAYLQQANWLNQFLNDQKFEYNAREIPTRKG